MRSWSKCVIFSRRMKSSSRAGPRRPALSEFWLSPAGVSGRSADVRRVHAEHAGASIRKEEAQGFPHGPERQVVPGHFALGEEPGLDGFRAGVEVGVEQSRTIEEVD